MSRQSPGKGGAFTEPQAIDASWAAGVVPRRARDTHKWQVGGVVVIAGSPSFAGAAALCCAGAGRSGAGIVSAALPRSIAHVVVGLVPEVTVVLLPEGESSSVAKRAADAIEERLVRSKAMVVGPGLGRDEATSSLLGALFGMSKARGEIGFGVRGGAAAAAGGVVQRFEHPVVVDADALNWLAGQEQWWDRLREARLVLTPHAGEMARLMMVDVSTITDNPARAASDAAALWGQVVVLKGGRTIIADPEGGARYADASPALATAGSGDTLSGSIGAFLAQGLAPRDAAALAVYVGGRAADRLSERLGTLGVVAGDLPLAIAEELGVLEAQGA